MKITDQTFIDYNIIEKLTLIADDLEALYHKDIEVIAPDGVKSLHDVRTQAYRIVNNINMILKFNSSYWDRCKT